MSLEREKNELWVLYLARRLEEESIALSPWRLDSELNTNVSYLRSISEHGDNELNIRLKLKDGSSLDEVIAKDGSIRVLDIFSQKVWIASPEEDGQDYFHAEFIFNDDNTVTYARTDGNIDFQEYQDGQTYDAQQVVNNIVMYMKQFSETANAPLTREQESPPEVRQSIQSAQKGVDPRLEEILQVVRRLDQRTAAHPMLLEGEDRYYTRLYTERINEDVKNLQFFEYNGERIPYILVDSSQIGGNTGKPFKNLYFVAVDHAPEVWQQQIIAVHESMCVKQGHEIARAEEPKVAAMLGKTEEYQIWRTGIDKLRLE